MKKLWKAITFLIFSLGFILHLPLSAGVATTVTGDTICAGDSAYVFVTPLPGKTYSWYDNSTGGNLLGTGDTLWTGPLSTTTTYWVEEQDSGLQQVGVGPANNSIASGTNYTYFPDGLKFTALGTVQIDTVFVYPNSSGNVVINIKNDAGTVTYSTTTVAVSGGGKTPIPLNECLTAGSYRMDAVGTSTGGLFRNTGGATYPYNSSLLNITGANNGSTTFYYFFYDWKLSSVCGSGSSSIDSVQVTVLPSPTASFGNDQTICNGDSVQLTMSGGQSYLWSTGDTSASVTVYNQGTVWGTGYGANGCLASDTIDVSLINVLSPGLVSDTMVCAGDSFQLCSQGATGTTYLWSTGGTSACLWASGGNSYSVTVTDTNGCQESETSQVALRPVPSVSFTADTSNCPNISFQGMGADSLSTWSWDFGDGSTGTGQNPVTGYPANGQYTVSLVVTNACGTDSTSQQIEITCFVGREDLLMSDYQLYPNPSNGEVWLSYPVQAMPIDLAIYDLKGRLLFEKQSNGLSGEMHLSPGLDKGLYLVRILRGEGQLHYRLFVD